MKNISPQKSLKRKRKKYTRAFERVLVQETNTNVQLGKFSSDIKENLFGGFQTIASTKKKKKENMYFIEWQDDD